MAGGRAQWQDAKASLVSQFPSTKGQFTDSFGTDIDKMETIYGQIVAANAKDSTKISSQWPEAIKLTKVLKTTIDTYRNIILPLTSNVGDPRPGSGVAISLKMEKDVDADKDAKAKALKALQDIENGVDNIVKQCNKVTKSSPVCS